MPGEYRLYSSRNLEKTEVITNTSDTFTGQGEVLAYPNPATNNITVSAKKEISKIRIYSLTGRKIYESEPVNDRITIIPVENLTPGVYFIHVFQKDNRMVQKIVIN